MKRMILSTLLSFLGYALASADSGATRFRIHGKAWLDAGKIEASHDSLTNDGSGNTINLEGSWLQSVGAQFTANADFSENMDGAFGFGAYKATHSLGTFMGNSKVKYYAISLFQNFITEARVRYFIGEKGAPRLSFTVGNFPYSYTSNSKNLGSYLLRGPVYPGLLFGGFEDFSIDSSKANILGAVLHHSTGFFSHDLIFKSEYDIPPTFDWSIAYVAKIKALEAIEAGAGVNFYRAIPYNSKLEKPGKMTGLDAGRSIEVDTTNPAAPDTLFLTHQGVKLVGTLSLDLNHWFGFGILGPQDLKLYGEVAVLGLQNYGKTYNDIKRRMPMMVGFNLPTFNWFDYISVEYEYYNSPYRNDLANIGTLNGVADWTIQLPNRPTPSPAPVTGPYADSTRDNSKWSVNVKKTVAGHVQFLGQVANDHYRPRPMATGLINSTGGTAEAFTTPKDWYWMLRVGLSF